MRHALLSVCAFLSFGWIVHAQLAVDVSLVNIPVTVTDRNGRHVPGLLPDDFAIQEDGRPQEIVHLTDSSDLPVSLGILLDTSISMSEMMAPAKAAVEQFVRSLPSNDEVFLMTFDNGYWLHQSFTKDREKLVTRLRKVQVNQAGTHLFDALLVGINDARTGKNERKTLVLFSDGSDNHHLKKESTQLSDVLFSLRQSRLLVYCVGVLPNAFGMDILRSIAQTSGGNVWRVDSQGSANQMQNVLSAIAEELRHQYIIGYYPGHKVKDGKLHRVNVALGKPQYTVRYRKEYLGE